MKFARRSTRAIGLLALVVSGCAVGPRYTTPEAVQVEFTSPERALFAPDPVQKAWWREFEDPQLDALVDEALRSNLDVRVAAARLQAARADERAAELDRWPVVTVGAERSRSISQGNDGPAGVRTPAEQSRVGFDASWEIDLFGRLQHLNEAATAMAEGQAADLAQVRIVVVAELARNYFEMRGAEQRAELTLAALQSLGETVAVTESRVAAGRGLPGELSSARAARAARESEFPMLETIRRTAAHRVAVLAGQTPAELTSVLRSQPLQPLNKQFKVGDLGALLRRRPDVLQAERGMAASTALVGAATADLYPRLDLGGFLGFVALRGSELGQSSTRAFSTSAAVNWPAFRLGSAKARLLAAEAGLTGAHAGYELVVLRAVEEVENALTGYGQNQERLRSLLGSMEHARQAARLAEARYREGAAPYQEVLEAQRTVIATQDSVAQAETASYTHLVALYKALGGGWDEASDVSNEGGRDGSVPRDPHRLASLREEGAPK